MSLQGLENLSNRVTLLEGRLEAMQNNFMRIESEHNSLRRLTEDFKVSVIKLQEYTDRIKTFETDVRLLHEKLMTYEFKFQSLDDLKKLIWGVILAVIPGSAGVVLQVVQFLSNHKLF